MHHLLRVWHRSRKASLACAEAWTENEPGAAVGLAASELEVAKVGDDDELDVGQAGVPLHHLGGAEGFLDLAVHLLRRVLHEDGRVGIALGHLLLTLPAPHDTVEGKGSTEHDAHRAKCRSGQCAFCLNGGAESSLLGHHLQTCARSMQNPHQLEAT